jgi:S-DNA-T family DNA segregation ATPase FtsK/SpoIIIE
LTKLALIAPFAALFMIGTYFLLWRGASAAILVVMASSVVLMIGLNVGLRVQQHRSQLGRGRSARARYLQRLYEEETRLWDAWKDFRSEVAWLAPPPETLIERASDPERRWERRRDHDDFSSEPVGRLAAAPFPVRINCDIDRDVDIDADEDLAERARQLVKKYSTVSDVRVGMPVLGQGVVVVAGDLARGRDVVRALLARLIVNRSPLELRLAVCGGSDDWRLKWAPHARHPYDDDFVTCFDGPKELAEALEPLIEARLQQLASARRFPHDRRAAQLHLVVVIDGYTPGAFSADPTVRLLMREARDLDITVICTTEQLAWRPEATAVLLELTSPDTARLREMSQDGRRVSDIRVDQMTAEQLERVCRVLGRYSCADDVAPTQTGDPLRLSTLLGIEDWASFPIELTQSGPR